MDAIPLFGTETLASAPLGTMVVVTEGEKACKALTSRGLLAVATVTGAGTAQTPVSRMLGHADVTLTVHTCGAWLQPDRRAAVDALDRTPAAETAEEARA